MTTQVSTKSIFDKISDLKNQLLKTEKAYTDGYDSLTKDLLKVEALFEKYGITNFEGKAFVDEYFNFRVVENSYVMSSGTKAKNFQKALRALDTSFYIVVFDPAEYKGTSLASKPARVNISMSPIFNNLIKLNNEQTNL